jgi:hypothetical protein
VVSAPNETCQEQQIQADTAAHDKAMIRPFAGHAPSFCIEDVSTNKDRNIMADFQLCDTITFRAQMAADEVYRTIRLGPSELLCSRHVETSWAQKAQRALVTWRYDFDVAVLRAKKSYVNIGLVEWIAPIREPAFQALQTCGDVRLSLAELMGLRPGEEWKTEPEWQQVAENPKQRMLGCRKGVKWYGDRHRLSEPLFQDDILEGSILRFQCDHVFDESGYLKEMKLWLAASKVNFRWREPKGESHTVDLQRPLLEWPSLGEQRIHGEHDRLQSVWVPAVTFFNKDDAVLFSWAGRENPMS